MPSVFLRLLLFADGALWCSLMMVLLVDGASWCIFTVEVLHGGKYGVVSYYAVLCGDSCFPMV